MFDSRKLQCLCYQKLKVRNRRETWERNSCKLILECTNLSYSSSTKRNTICRRIPKALEDFQALANDYCGSRKESSKGYNVVFSLACSIFVVVVIELCVCVLFLIGLCLCSYNCAPLCTPLQAIWCTHIADVEKTSYTPRGYA